MFRFYFFNNMNLGKNPKPALATAFMGLFFAQKYKKVNVRMLVAFPVDAIINATSMTTELITG